MDKDISTLMSINIHIQQINRINATEIREHLQLREPDKKWSARDVYG
jgi:hypothetical protein